MQEHEAWSLLNIRFPHFDSIECGRFYASDHMDMMVTFFSKGLAWGVRTPWPKWGPDDTESWMSLIENELRRLKVIEDNGTNTLVERSPITVKLPASGSLFVEILPDCQAVVMTKDQVEKAESIHKDLLELAEKWHQKAEEMAGLERVSSESARENVEKQRYFYGIDHAITAAKRGAISTVLFDAVRELRDFVDSHYDQGGEKTQ